jgi:hypothetical protein
LTLLIFVLAPNQHFHAAPWRLSIFLSPAQFSCQRPNFSGLTSAGGQIFLVVAGPEFCSQQNFAVAAIPCHTLAPFHFLELNYSLITMYKHNIHHGYTSRNQVCNTDLSIYGPQAARLHYHDGDNGGGSSRRFALHEDSDIPNDDALCLEHHIWHAPAELARDSGSMLLGTSLL